MLEQTLGRRVYFTLQGLEGGIPGGGSSWNKSLEVGLAHTQKRRVAWGRGREPGFLLRPAWHWVTHQSQSQCWVLILCQAWLDPARRGGRNERHEI